MSSSSCEVTRVIAQAVEAPSSCPFHAPDDFDFQSWLQRGLMCSAGKREFRFARYQVALITDGVDLAQEIDFFRAGVREHAKTGLLAILSGAGPFSRSLDELAALGRVMAEAGLCESAQTVIDGETVVVEIETPCPVTNEPTTYSFFPVAFCKHANNPADELYDPSLSAPFTAINMTSDAFAFALLVRDQAVRQYQRRPDEIADRSLVENLFEQAVGTWQSMSANTINAYNKTAVCPERAVSLSEDGREWYAPHNDPVFAERKKIMHSHEMPVVYARRLCDIWLSALFDGAVPKVGREGQSGGILVA